MVILGEAAKQVPNSIRERNTDVPWRKIAGLRDITVHRYFGLDEEVLWDVLQSEIGPLLNKINRIIIEESPE